ncbi:hypothetical protein [Blastococcus sp. TF02A-30]|uniref:hypothetical protein n=1 Tax=Blastococcus sp. TF02A-30 TaxID=2250580 RepID=UPI000DEA4659|nr:hypothetical protein [Blastococcus sp. TF02A-30]RBY84525.1 hypothetical protein DQ241_17770 [Blastococcus sp. TF02A-30]
MPQLDPPPALWPVEAGLLRRAHAPDVTIDTEAGPPVHLLLVTEWLESIAFHLSWPWTSGDPVCSARQAYRLEDAAGHALPLIDSRVMPLAGRMNEVTFFDTTSLDGPQTLALRLRCRLAVPLDIPVGG